MNMHTMLGFVGRWQPWTVPAVLSHLWQSTVVALAILALMFAARRMSARTRWALGWIGLIKFLLPLFIFTPTFVRIQPRSLSPWLGESFATSLSERAPVISSSGNHTTRDAVHEEPVERVHLSVGNLATAVWAVGAVTLWTIWFLRGWRFRRRILAESEPVSDSLQRSIEHARNKVGLAISPRCLAIKEGTGPGILGVVDPVVVLPRFMECSLSEAEMETILIHEFIHLRRRDTLWIAVQSALVRTFWFHPLVWALNRRLYVETEKSCDEEVLKLTSDPKTYAGGIIKMVRRSLGLHQPAFAGASGVPIVARVENILAKRPHVHRRGPILAALGAALLFVGLSGFTGAVGADPTSPPAAPAGKVLVFRNIRSWDRHPDFEEVLKDLGYAYDVKKSEEMATTDLNGYSLVVIPGAQWRTGYYVDYAKASDRINRFVEAGGTLVVELNGAEQEGITLPGGAAMVQHPSYDNLITMPGHPALAPFVGKVRISANWASHGYLKNVPKGALVLAVEMVPSQLKAGMGKPTYVEYSFGSGRVIGACQCFHDRDGSGRGPLMPAVLKYAMAKTWYVSAGDETQQLSAALSATVAQEAPKVTTIIETLQKRKDSPRPSTGDVTLPTDMKPINSWTNAGQRSPIALVETVNWACSRGDIDTLAKTIVFDTEGKVSAAEFWAGLSPDAQAKLPSPEYMTAALIEYGYPTGIGYRVTGDNQVDESPNAWDVHSQYETSDGHIHSENFRLQRVEGNWMLVCNPGNIAGLGRLVTGGGELPPPAKN